MYKVADYICVIENAMPINQLNVLDEICRKNIFGREEAQVISNNNKPLLDNEVRKTKIRHLFNCGPDTTMTMSYWSNYLKNLFEHYTKVYANLRKVELKTKVTEIQLLTYEVGDFYKKHCDSFKFAPRHLSYVYLINDDYVGGDLCFEFPNDNQTKVPVKKNSLIIWPSNFMYPHQVLPVKEGVKYSIVSWAL